MVSHLTAIVVALPPSFGVTSPMPFARHTLEPSMTERYPIPKNAESDAGLIGRDGLGAKVSGGDRGFKYATDDE